MSCTYKFITLTNEYIPYIGSIRMRTKKSVFFFSFYSKERKVSYQFAIQKHHRPILFLRIRKLFFYFSRYFQFFFFSLNFLYFLQHFPNFLYTSIYNRRRTLYLCVCVVCMHATQ